MNRFIKYTFGAFLAALFTFQSVCQAFEERIGGLSTGVTSTTYRTSAGKEVKESTIFSAYDFDDTARYNSAGGTAVSSGWINIQDYNDDILFMVNLATLASTNLTITFQGLISDDTSNPIEIYPKVFTATDTDYSLSVAEGALKYVRIKGITTGDATDACTILMRAEGERK